MTTTPEDFGGDHFVSLLRNSAGPLSAQLSAVRTLANRSAPLADIAAELGTRTRARESVPTALAVVAVTVHRGFTECVESAVGIGGDTDTIGAMVGACAGALHGASAIPGSWLINLAGDQDVVQEGRRYADAIWDHLGLNA